MTIATVFLTGPETLLFWASQVTRRPESARPRSGSTTREVTVVPALVSEPEAGEDPEGAGSPPSSQRTRGLGRPEKKFID